MSGKVFRILAIDGGGIRGIFPAYVLHCITDRLGINIVEHFDMVAGTSTGSIIAAAIVCKIEPEKIMSLYRQNGADIFVQKRSYWPRIAKPAFHSLYDNNKLDNMLKDLIGDIKLGEISKPLILPATNAGYGGVHVFKSNYCRDFTRDKNVKIREAVLASCAAPTFFNPVKVGEYLLADGGLWANNPSLVAFIDAQRRLGIKSDDIQILSLGTGHSRIAYGVQNNKEWGFLNGWKGPSFINFLLSLQAQSIHNYLGLMMDKKRLLRIDFETDKPLPLDNCSTIDDLVSHADREFTYKSTEIMNFFNNTSEWRNYDNGKQSKENIS